MSLFSFVKAAGRLLGGRHDAVQDDSKPAPPPPAADAVASGLARTGLGADNLNVAVEGDQVKISGTAPDAATREKLILAAGNIAGIASVEDAIETNAQGSQAGPQAPFHTVVRGETLSAIARQHYGSANAYPKIFEANRPMLRDADHIYPGQVLRIPAQT